MSSIQTSPSLKFSRLKMIWRAVTEGYRYLNIVTHHGLGIALKLLVGAYFIFCLLLLTLRYAVLPNIAQYKGDVEQVASKAIGQQVTVSKIQASWRGLRPHFSLDDVVIHDKEGKPALTLPNVSATLSWWSIFVADVRLHKLEVNQPDMDIRRDAQGNLYVAGIYIDMQKTGDGKGADWVLSQNEIVIRDGRLRWNDAKRGAPELLLTGVNSVLRNHWRHHMFGLKATPPESFAAPLDIRADFEHPRFSKRISDFTHWKGEIYVGLEKADLTVWKPFIDYPIDLQKGQGAVFAWLKFEYAKVVNFTADLTLANVTTRLSRNLEPLDLVKVQGRMSLQEDLNANVSDGTPTLGMHGHTIALTDFTFTANNGLVFPATTLTEQYTPAKGKELEKIEVQAKFLDLRTLAKFSEYLPIPQAQRQLLVDYAPRGQVRDFSVQWQGTYPQLTSYKIKGQFENLGLNDRHPQQTAEGGDNLSAQIQQTGFSGFDNLTGSIEVTQSGGEVNLASNKFKLILPGYFADPTVLFDKLNMRAQWEIRNQDQIFVQLEKLDILQDGLRASFYGTHLMPLKQAKEKSFGTIDLTGRIVEFDLKKIDRILPLQTPEQARTWLIGALQDGKLKDGALRVKGDLNKFPFRAESAADKAKGEFSLSGRIENGKLNYAPGAMDDDEKLPLWPEISEINGLISFDRTRLEIKATSAKTSGVDLQKVKVQIPNLWTYDKVLEVDGNAYGPLQNFVQFTNESPVDHWIGHFTEDTKATGNASLALKLQLPLARLNEAKVQGTLRFERNDITLQSGMPPLSQTGGTLEFNEHGINLPGIKSNLLGSPFNLSGGTQADGAIRIKADGGITADGLRKAYTSPTMQRLLKNVSGSTRFNTVINIKKGQPEVVIESSLQGMALSLPTPLGKAANEVLPIKFELVGMPASANDMIQDEIKVTLGSTIAARYLRQKPTAKKSAWRVVRGGIGINTPAPQPDYGLIASVNLKSLNVDAWSNFVVTVIGNEKQLASQTDTPGISQYIEPEMVAANATEMILMGKKLDNVVVGASHQKGIWQSNIESEQISGYVTWNESTSGRGMGKVTARLTSMVIPKSAASGVTDILAGKNASSQIPALDVIAENFELMGKKFGRLELLANNANTLAAREWRISKLAISNPDGEFNATGKWLIKDGENNSSLNYQLDIADAGKLLERLGFPNVLRRGKGKMNGEINWKGLPYAFDLASLSGTLNIDLKSGQFLKVDPSAAKLLGVLSLQSLPRRLILDFRDVFSEGFAFDGVVAHADINNGVLKTDSFKMRSVSATVLMDGTADLIKETTSLHVVLLPDVNAGAASALYGILVNPAVGLGTFLAQLFFRAPLTRALTREYQINGPWSDPVITQLKREPEKTNNDTIPPMSGTPVEGVN
jgi:uncharacterized protein (TIGR02099 family)